ncbi:nuclear transport factor 2 family protein [Leptospira sp. 201903071]|uniref:nuclear transport factor 2 family protein n=1 Tax=Leptospira ainazelensis TaxID=2810034 RepID=UPI0019622B78|nr:nuclear transport factor 2 family protein [Leptospira ainazelensis]MBM9502097.1 nuclear transport factor 2 family protein [Leptospira ainazelensis]
MNLEDNKRVVLNYFQGMNEKRFSDAAELLSDELVWWIIGKTKVSGKNDKRTVLLGFKLLHRTFSDFNFILHDFTAEDNRVSLTAESKGKHSNGKLYNNHYHFLFTIENGKIQSVKEYLDTEHAIWIEQMDSQTTA